LALVVNRFFRGCRISCKWRISEACNRLKWWLSLCSHIYQRRAEQIWLQRV